MKKNVLHFMYLLLPFSFASADTLVPTVGAPHTNQEKFIEVYGHRGARAYSPENTIPSFNTALKVGVHWVDIDIVMTKDNKIVGYHDLTLNPNILRDKNGEYVKSDKIIFGLNFSDLQQYDAGKINPDSNYATFFPAQVPVNGTKIPLLEEIITYINKNSKNKVNFQLEIKTNPEHNDWSATPEKYAIELYKILKKYNIINRTEIQAFDWRYLYALKALDKNIKTAFLIETKSLLEMSNPDAEKATLWTGGKLLKDYNYSILKMIKALGGDCYEPEDVSLTKSQLDEAHQLGLKVVVWSWPEQTGKIFDTDLMSRLIEWGVDGIITDDPGQLNSMLAARGYTVPKNYP